MEVAIAILDELKKSTSNRTDQFIEEQLREMQKMNSELIRIRVENEKLRQEAADQAKDQQDANNRNRPPAQNPSLNIPKGGG